MFGLIRSVVSTVVNTVTLPITIMEDMVNGEVAPRTEKQIGNVVENVKDAFTPSEW